MNRIDRITLGSGDTQAAHHSRGRRHLAHPAEVAGQERNREQGDHALGAVARTLKHIEEDLGGAAQASCPVALVENVCRVLKAKMERDVESWLRC